MPKKDPNYDYERNADRTVTLRLMKVYGHYYNLLFTTEDLPSDRSFIPPLWHEVREYVPSKYWDAKPGENPNTTPHGNWVKQTFYIEDAKKGEDLLLELRKRIHTVKDIYTHFIADGVTQREIDMEHYNSYQKQLKVLPAFIG